MDYGRILGDAFHITRNSRFLWLFGLFAGGSAGSGGWGSNFQLPSAGLPGEGAFSELDPEAEAAVREALQAIAGWVSANLGVILAVAGLLVALNVALIALAAISKGAMIGSVAQLGRGEQADLRSAWGLGTRYAWRYIGLWLLLIVFFLALALVFGLAGLVLIVLGQLGAQVLAIALGVLVALVGVVLFIPFAIAFTIVETYAEQAIAIDDLGVFGSLKRATRLLATRLGSSLLLWLISIVVGIGIGIVVAIALLVLLLPAGLVMLIAYLAGGLGPAMWIVGGLLALGLIGLLWGISAVANTYTHAYWTLGYLSASERYPPSAL